MKKSKCILTTLTATVFAMSVGALVACGDSSDGETKVGVYEITFDANGGAYANGNTAKLHTADGRILAEPTAPEYTGFVFTGYNVKRDGSGEQLLSARTDTSSAARRRYMRSGRRNVKTAFIISRSTRTAGR